MFEAHFGLRENPFSTSHDPRFVYPSPEHLEAVAHFRYGLQNHEGFVLVTGEVGTGKTTAIMDLVSRLPQHAQVALIQNTALSRPELVEEICRRFGVEVDSGLSKPALLQRLEQTMRERAERGQVCLLVVDEAQNLSPEMLEEIRLLSNFELGSGSHFLICLVGQPELEERLARSELRQLRQRIGVKYNLQPLDRVECGRYLHHRLRVAGGDGEYLFPSDTTELLHSVTNGIPREINIVAGQAMLNAYVDNAPTVRPEHVLQVVEDFAFQSVMGGTEPTRPATEPPPVAAAPPSGASPPPRVASRPAAVVRGEPPDPARSVLWTSDAPAASPPAPIEPPAPPEPTAPPQAPRRPSVAPIPAASFAASEAVREPTPEPHSAAEPIPASAAPSTPPAEPAEPMPAPPTPPISPPERVAPPEFAAPVPVAAEAQATWTAPHAKRPPRRFPAGLVAAVLLVLVVAAAVWTGALQRLWENVFPPAVESNEADLPAAGEQQPVPASPVAVETAAPTPAATPRNWTVQVASYQSLEQARETLRALETRTGVSGIVVSGLGEGEAWHAVRLGDFATRAEARARAEEWTERELIPIDRFVVAPSP